MLTVQNAITEILANTIPNENQIAKSLMDSKNFILAEEITSDRDYPPFPRATMDGYALKIEELEKANQFNLIGEIYAGDDWEENKEIKPFSCIKIMTGAAVPNEFDIIIKVEDTTQSGNIVLIKTDKIKKWLNIAKQGEDAKKDAILVNPGSKINDSILTVAVSFGYSRLNVYTPPKISLISTGNEVLPEGLNPLPYQIRDSNSVTLTALLLNYNCEIIRQLNLKDDPKILKENLSLCIDSDICIITGGVSAGDADFIPSTLKSLGVKEIFHKVMIRPGKPIWFGKKDKTLFFGLPGNPVSARITFKVFVEPSIKKFLHSNEQTDFYFPILAARRKKHSLEEYFRVKIVSEGNHSYLQEVPNNGSGDFIGSLGSDGVAIHPADTLELPKAELVKFLFW